MTTTAKKRVPKPTATPATDALLAVLPLIADDPGKLSDRKIVDLVCEFVEHLVDGLNNPVCDWRGFRKGLADNTALLGYMRDTAANIREAIANVSPGRDEPPNNDLCRWIGDGLALDAKTRDRAVIFYEGGFEMMGGGGFEITPDVAVKLYRAHVTEAAWDSLLHGTHANGWHYVGCCPRCGKVFEKKQSNAEYCSKSCANMVSRDRRIEA